MALGGLPLAVMIPLASISTLLTIALGAQSYYEAWKKLVQSRTLTMDTLFSISTISVLIVSLASFFVPWLPMMFEAGLLIYGFRHIGIAIEDTIKDKISSAKFQDRAPQKVRLYRHSDFKKRGLKRFNPTTLYKSNQVSLYHWIAFVSKTPSFIPPSLPELSYLNNFVVVKKYLPECVWQMMQNRSPSAF